MKYWERVLSGFACGHAEQILHLEQEAEHSRALVQEAEHSRALVQEAEHLGGVENALSSFRARALTQSANGKFSKPGSKPNYGPDYDWDSQHILLQISCNIQNKTIEGKCTTSLKAINDGIKEIPFDAVRMKILSVSSSTGQKLKYHYDQEKLTVKLPKPFRRNQTAVVSIRYRLNQPIAGIYFVGPDKFYPKKPVQVWTHGEAEESRYWFPCFDAPHDKASTELIATVPRDFFALSNGALINVKENKTQKTKTYHWKQWIPHSAYLVTFVAGKFSEIKEEWNGIPILYYCEPGREEETKRAFGKTPKMVQFFSKVTGVKYPYEKYAQIAVADFFLGGMEHTTATTQTDRVLMDRKAYPEFTADWLVSHELAHQWFGDLLTCKEWSHAWLNESFATYFEALFTEMDLGADEFHYEMHEKLHSYLEEDKRVYRRPIVTNVYRKPDDLFDRHLYEKGSLVLHTLRYVLGEKQFWNAIQHYTRAYQGRAVETSDLVNAIQESTGKNMRKFFDQWVYGPGHPEYQFHYRWDPETKQAHLVIIQKSIENHSYFSVPVVIEFDTPSGRKKFTETIDKKDHHFKYRFPQEPLDVRIDPEYRILKTSQMNKPYKMWVRQLMSDSHVIGRAAAAREIGKIATEESLDILIQAFLKEKFWGTADEIVLAIGATGLEKANSFLLRALKTTKHPKVRRAVAEALGPFNDKQTILELTKTLKNDKSYFVAAQSLSTLANARSPRAFKVIKNALKMNSWNDVIRASAVKALSKIPKKESIRLFLKHVRYGFHPNTRASAVYSITKLARSYPELFDTLFELTSDPQVRIKHAALSALGNLKDPRTASHLEKISKDKNLPYRTRFLAEDSLLKIKPIKIESR